MVAFATEFDAQPVHLDEASAFDTIFPWICGERIAHGGNEHAAIG